MKADRNISGAAALICAGMLLLTGCGSGDSSQASGGKESKSEISTASPAAEESSQADEVQSEAESASVSEAESEEDAKVKGPEVSEIHGEAGDNITWSLNSEGLLTFTGTGKMYDYTLPQDPNDFGRLMEKGYSDFDECPEWIYAAERKADRKGNSLPGGVVKAVISGGITEIGNCFMYRVNSLAEIEIPEGVTRIGDSAFYWCSGIKSIMLPSTLTDIDDFAFYGTDFESVTIPEGVTEIKKGAFSHCSFLTDIKLPSGLKRIGEHGFSGNSKLTKLDLPEGLESIGEDAFTGCLSLDEITVPASVTEIGKEAFGYMKEGFVLKCTPGSAAEKYAKENGINYKTV